MNRRGQGEGSLYWDESRRRWVAETTVGFDGQGKRIVRKARGATKTAAREKLREMVRDLDDGIAIASTGYTVGQAMEDWLQYGLGRQGEKTIAKYRSMSETHIVPFLGSKKLRELTARDVEIWLLGRATG